jgi:predicted Ser/Thr protein kinase
VKVCPACGTEYGDEAAFCSRDRSPLAPKAPEAGHGLLGTVVGDRYQVDSRLGEGGMGEVYLATHVLMGRQCALKVMSPALSKDPDAVTRFNREATNASKISHPNVCAVYDFGLTPDGLVYLAMEYVEGRTLTAVAEERGPMPVASATELVAQCAAGLEAAHDLGIVHRDLKPDNIMVINRGGKETVKLVDFGIAKAMEGEPSQRVTKTGFVVGTPEYMSPEQLAGDPLDGRSDEYSLALVLYRLITGRLPFEGSSIQETLVKRLTDAPQPLLIARPEGKFPEGLQAVMDRALARYPANRYPTVAAFVQALRGVVPAAGAPTGRMNAVPGRNHAEIPATRRRPGAPRRRSGPAFAVAGVLVVALGAWGVVHFTRTPATVSAPPSPPALDTGRTAAGDSAKGAGVLPTSAPVTPLAPVPAPAPPPKQKEVNPITTAAQPVAKDTAPGDAATAVEADTVAPDLSALDSPVRKRLEIQRAFRILRNRFALPRHQAAAAAFLGQVALDAGKKDTALFMFRRAYKLNPKPAYRQLIRQLGDTITP